MEAQKKKHKGKKKKTFAKIRKSVPYTEISIYPRLYPKITLAALFVATPISKSHKSFEVSKLNIAKYNVIL